MIEKMVATVPGRIWAEGKPARMRVWEAEFNVASWIRVHGGNCELKLLVCHTDESGAHQALVDRTLIDGEGSALMSGLVRLRFTGEVSGVEIRLAMSDPSVRHQVDELFFQRRGSALSNQDKLISNF